MSPRAGAAVRIDDGSGRGSLPAVRDRTLGGPGTEEEDSVAKTTAHALSVIVPTKNEEGNVEPLIARIEHALDPVTTEVVFVDDSDDRTAEHIQVQRAKAACRIELVHRPPAERRGGLGGAVLEGISVARTPWVCVMDADLQHPPELIPKLLATALNSNASLVVASRYTRDGSMGAFGRGRRLISRASAGAARLAFPLRLKAVSDPMSGFFLVRRDAVDVAQLRPQGFKILLEILARQRGLSVAEVPFVFGKRYRGETKASLREGLVYGFQLLRLRCAAFLPLRTRPSRRAFAHLGKGVAPPEDEEGACAS
jgi:glycosyltransferase involved in cell wall biosynthesis